MLRCRFLSVCLVLMLGVTPAPAQTKVDDTDGPDFWAVTGVASWDALNLRAAPDADSKRIARIPYNARRLKNLGCPNFVTFEQWKRMTPGQKDGAARSRWCQVEYNGLKGWVAGRFLKEDGGN